MSDSYRSEYTLQELREIYGEDTEGVREVISLFNEDAPPRLQRFTAAMEAGDYEGAAKAAHGLNNLLGAVRNHTGAAIARIIEHQLRQGEREKVSREQIKLVAEVQRTVEEIEAAE